MKGALVTLGIALAWTAAGQTEVVLWPGGAPGSEGRTSAAVEEPGRVSGVNAPTVTAYLPEKGQENGTAVLVCPGGGHRYLAIQHEGHDVGRWFAARGVAAFVLKYRLEREEGSPYKIEVHALADAQRALRVIRARAAEWGVKPDRVGIIGFSAGGEVAALAMGRFAEPLLLKEGDAADKQSSRPDFAMLIYPGRLADQVAMPKDAPPAFLVSAYDDKNPSLTVAKVYLALREQGVNAELHVWRRGGHGYGLRSRPLPITGWSERLLEWLKDSALIP